VSFVCYIWARIR